MPALPGVLPTLVPATGPTAWSPGDLKLSAVAAVPSGWLICDGSAVSRTTYAALFTAVAVLYGTGDGSTTFNLPDLRGRVPVGPDPTGVHMPTHAPALASASGEEAHLMLTAEGAPHTHTGTTATGSTGTGSTGTGSTGTGTTGTESTTHTHQPGQGGVFVTAGAGTASTTALGSSGYDIDPVTTTESSSHTHSAPSLSVPSLSVPALSIPALGLTIASTPAATAHNNVQPYIGINYLIKI